MLNLEETVTRIVLEELLAAFGGNCIESAQERNDPAAARAKLSRLNITTSGFFKGNATSIVANCNSLLNQLTL